ncbi:MAG: cytochrome c-type biogenesis protein CcmH [Gammaproteobacteria bacterium]|nr:cytochrome c-type biogenesis protein CcmH [Gammaproteobacteria bacterium]
MLLALSASVSAQSADLRSFEDPALQARYAKLIAELRCLVCQNQSVADSDADLAKDLRARVHKMLQAGQSDRDITDFMVERFGDFVLYRPPLKPSTLALWIGPFLMAIGGLIFLFRLAKRRTHQATPSLSEAEEDKLRQVLSGTPTDPPSPGSER